MATSSVQIEDLAQIPFEALLSGDEVDQIEAIAQTLGRNRRMVLAVLMHSRQDMLDRFSRDHEAFDDYMEMVECIRAYKKHLAGLQEQAECAESRLLAALCAMSESEVS